MKAGTIELTPGLLSMPVIARGGGGIYLRLPRELQRDCGGCSCDYCKAHPGETPMWDTLAIPTEDTRQNRAGLDSSWTVHMPDPETFRAAMRRKTSETSAEITREQARRWRNCRTGE